MSRVNNYGSTNNKNVLLNGCKDKYNLEFTEKFGLTTQKNPISSQLLPKIGIISDSLKTKMDS